MQQFDDLIAATENHLIYSYGKRPEVATLDDVRNALSLAVRDRIVEPWHNSINKGYEGGHKKVYYLSLEFLMGRLLEDALVNLGLYDEAKEAVKPYGFELHEVVESEPDAALGNGGLGRLAAGFLDSLATLGVPAIGYGIRYEHGIFRQEFQDGQQVERPEDWLSQEHPWEFMRHEISHEIYFGGEVADVDGKAVWRPRERVVAMGYDTPVIGWQGKWANALRLWEARSTRVLDLQAFNRGDFTGATEPERTARTISRVLYPDDTTQAGKELRLKQEYFFTAASLADILRRFFNEHDDIRKLPDHVAIQLNDTHPAIAGPELIRVLIDIHGLDFDDAVDIAQRTLNYTNHTLLPEALERWSVYMIGSILPRHMQLIEQVDAWHKAKFANRPDHTSLIQYHEVLMGNLAFILANKVNGVSALHTDLVKSSLFRDLGELHPNRIVNQTNGITPRRWLVSSNRPLSRLITSTIGTGWEDNLERLIELEPSVEEKAFRDEYAAAKRAKKEYLANWVGQKMGITIDPDAIFDTQVKRIHEYKRQLLNILETIGLWHQIRENPNGDFVPRVKFFGGKAAPGYFVAKEIIRLINDVAKVVNNDPLMKDRLKVVYPPNYNVSMAEFLIPAADLSEQISTAGTEASGTGNMKFSLNGALTIGTLDGANVEIREHVGAENFFLFGLTTDEVNDRRHYADAARRAIEASENLKSVLQILAEGQMSPEEPSRYHALVDRVWNHDYYLVASDYEDYRITQRKVDDAYKNQDNWFKMAAYNTARMGYFSTDRTIKGYMEDIWNAKSAL